MSQRKPRATEPIVLAAPVRTPIGKFGGTLSVLSAADLGAAAASACLERAGLDPAVVDQTLFGHGRQAGGGPNTARQVSDRAGVPVEKPAFTINQACGSGLQSVLSAARHLLLGEAEVVLAGGTESMSNTPYMLPRARWGYRLGHAELTDGMYRDGFNDPLSGLAMGETAEELAEDYGISRETSDEWALTSQTRCQVARESGRFEQEVVSVTVPGRRGDVVVDADEHPRDGVTREQLAKLPSVFRDRGRVTPGNASGITDGAAALLVATEAAAERHDLPVVGRLVDWQVVGVEPRIMGIGPVPATQALLERNGLDFSEIDQVELNEAFACQVVACMRDLPFDEERVNPDGGAIALGHPIGATGARILVTLLHGLARREGRYGVATLCVSGGLGLSALVERI
ncbi:MAG: thiolase family protein [Thermoanaerobaculia bacterium]|nr:thiolase family protein [Thermoanaerobaculia bacterium]